MQEEIINRVAQSSLVVFDLEDYYPTEAIKKIDISFWLYEGFILREKEFRSHLENFDWSEFKDSYVYLFCSTDAIIPGWAYLLITVYLQPFAKKTVYGTQEQLLTSYYQDFLSNLDYSKYQDKPVIIKGCAKHEVPVNVYLLAIQYLQPVAKSIMYGEACSAVPMYKAKKK